MSLVNTIRKTLVPIHPEGHKFIVAFFAVSLILGFLWMPLFWIGMIFTAWCAFFFRDPERVTPVSDDFVISPADGVVSQIVQSVPPREAGLGDEPLLRVSIFMNVFNCHINRSVAGYVSSPIGRAVFSTPSSTRPVIRTNATRW